MSAKNKSNFSFASIAVSFVVLSSTCLGQVEFLKQNWTPEVRQSFYTTTQGSRIMPYSWFIALETSHGQDSFAKTKLIQLGYLENDHSDDNPDMLPVGFVKDTYDLTPRVEYVGLTCAACHTNQLSYKGKTYQIDGAPALADMWGMLSSIDDSIKVTLDNDEKFTRFARKVLGSDAGNRAAVKDLKTKVTEFAKYWSQFIEDSRTSHPWGRGRLDAFGMIFNRVSSIDLGIRDNSRKPDAPVSYPFLWGTSFQSKVQWNGSVNNTNDLERLGRNVGEVLGVFAQAQFRTTSLLDLPRPARTSAKRLNLVKLENQLKTLWSPKWPDHLGAIDESKRALGEGLYMKHCVNCHKVVAHGKQNTPVEVSLTMLSEVQTDPRAAHNAASFEVSTGELKKLFQGRSKVPRDEMLQTLVQYSILSPYRDVASGNLFDRLRSDDVFSPEEIEDFMRETSLLETTAMKLMDTYQEKLESYYEDLRKTVEIVKDQPEVRTIAAKSPDTLRYKAAPLAGIWATAPYLHNGSVPNLYELLLPASERTAKFYVGNREFDPVRVGYVFVESEGASLFDTTIPNSGNSNSGHDTYGTFTEEERWQLVEYLKSL
jgi:hypothetical protein